MHRVNKSIPSLADFVLKLKYELVFIIFIIIKMYMCKLNRTLHIAFCLICVLITRPNFLKRLSVVVAK